MNTSPVYAKICVQRIASMDYLRDLVSAVQDICAQAQLQDADDFRVAVEEACVNIIHYAYVGQTTGSIELDVIWSEDNGAPAILCTLRDHGVRFNPLARPLPDLTLPAEERDIGGLGILFMRQMSDRVVWTYDANLGNCLTLIKYIQPPTSTASLST
jgi:serine/threonine-protein kinase RsbW